jgi:hypothetical protein
MKIIIRIIAKIGISNGLGPLLLSSVILTIGGLSEVNTGSELFRSDKLQQPGIEKEKSKIKVITTKKPKFVRS